MELLRRVLSGRLRTHTCRLCMCELLADEAVFGVGDRVKTSTEELSVAELLDRVCPPPEDYKQNILSNTLPINICRQCFQKVCRAYHLNQQCDPNTCELEHYISELYEKIDDIPTLSADAEGVFIYVEPLEPPENIEMIKPKLEIPNIIEKTEIQELETQLKNDVVTLINNKGVSDVYSVRADKRFVKLRRCEKADDLLKVEEITMKKQRLECKICGKEYFSGKWLAQHTNRMHGIIECENCKDEFENLAEYRQHIRSHSATYICDLCGRVFKFCRAIIQHLDGHLRVEGKKCICDLCGAQLCDEVSLQHHTATRHRPALITHTCYYCGRGYRGAASFEAHILKHETVQRSQYQCGECGAAFPSRVALRRHALASHRARRPHACAACGKCFRTALTLRDHRLVHERSRAHQCQTCGRGFVDARALTWHRRLHTGERPHACGECGRTFVSRNRRNQHAITAHTAPALQCPLCPALFHLRSMVNTHIQKVHLKEHKRRARPPRHIEVRWPTQKVPFEELSVHVQTEMLDRSINESPPPPGRRSLLSRLPALGPSLQRA